MKKNLYKDWLDSASFDLKTIEYIVHDETLTHLVAFHAQQCVEKCFKAVYAYNNTSIPKIHKLQTLYDNLAIQIDIDDTILIILDQLYIDARYPVDFGLLPYGKPSLEDARRFQVC